MKFPPASKKDKYAKWEWHHHPSGYALRNAYGCDDRDVEVGPQSSGRAGGAAGTQARGEANGILG